METSRRLRVSKLCTVEGKMHFIQLLPTKNGKTWRDVKCLLPLLSRLRAENPRSYADKIYIFAGYDGNNRVNDFWQYDTEHEVLLNMEE